MILAKAKNTYFCKDIGSKDTLLQKMSYRRKLLAFVSEPNELDNSAIHEFVCIHIYEQYKFVQ